MVSGCQVIQIMTLIKQLRPEDSERAGFPFSRNSSQMRIQLGILTSWPQHMLDPLSPDGNKPVSKGPRERARGEMRRIFTEIHNITGLE